MVEEFAAINYSIYLIVCVYENPTMDDEEDVAVLSTSISSPTPTPTQTRTPTPTPTSTPISAATPTLSPESDPASSHPERNKDVTARKKGIILTVMKYKIIL